MSRSRFRLRCDGLGTLCDIHERAVFEAPGCRAIFPFFAALVESIFAAEPFLSEDSEWRLVLGAYSGFTIEGRVAPSAAISERDLASSFLALAILVRSARASFAASVVAGGRFVKFRVPAPWALFVLAHARNFVGGGPWSLQPRPRTSLFLL
jgi:hypothetical protein